MADNLISLVSQYLTPDAISKIAAGTATDPAAVQKLTAAAVPALMASMASAVSAPGGAKALADAVENQDPALLDNLKASFGAENQIEMAVNGSKMLGSVLGDGTLSGLTGALSKFAGTESETTESVLGVVGPAITGVLGQQDPSAWSDPTAIAATLAAQKDNIMAAMPPGLGALLSGAGLAGVAAAGMQMAQGQMAAAGASAGAAAAGMAASASAALRPTAAPAAPAAAANAPAQPQGGGIPSWVYALIALVVIAALAYYFLGRGAEKKAEAPAVPAATTAAVSTAALGDVASMAKDVNGSLDALKTSLGSITDAASATAALPKIGEASAQLDKAKGMLDKLPADAKKTVAGGIAGAVSALTAQIDKVEALPGVGAIAKPALDGVKAKLADLAKV